MAIKAFNAVFGVSVGNVGNVISSGGDINAVDVTVTGIANLGNVANVKIGGGTANYYLKTDGLGNLSWSPVSGSANAAGSNTQVQFNDNGSFGASANFVFNQTTNALTVSGNINGANANLGNTVSANYFIGDGGLLSNISVGTGNAITNGNSNVTVTANSNVNISVAGNANVVVATGNGLVVNGTISSTGNIITGNIIGTLANGTSNISIPVANGNILFTAGGTANTMVLKTDGNVGIGSSNPAFKLEVNGSFAATSKSFVINHPSKPNHKLRYGSLESPYHGVRLTGEAAVINGYCKVDLPDYIKDLVKQEGSQVQVTPVKHGKTLWVEEINVAQNYFIIKSSRYKKYQDIELKFFWSFTAIRKDVEDMIVEFES